VPYIVGFGMLMSVLALIVGVVAWNLDDPAWQTILFTTLIFSQLALALEVRTEKQTLFSVGLLSNRAMLAAVSIGAAAHFALIYVPFLQKIFKTVPLGPRGLAISLAAAGVVIVATEAFKWWLRKSPKSQVPSLKS
jgi:Ca2+-transporting ATPase